MSLCLSFIICTGTAAVPLREDMPGPQPPSMTENHVPGSQAHGQGRWHVVAALPRTSLTFSAPPTQDTPSVWLAGTSGSWPWLLVSGLGDHRADTASRHKITSAQVPHLHSLYPAGSLSSGPVCFPYLLPGKHTEATRAPWDALLSCLSPTHSPGRSERAARRCRPAI